MIRWSALWHLPPREVLRLARRKLTRRIGWTAAELLASPKHANGGRFIDLLHRHEAILARAFGYKPLDFEGRRVLEIGCGPLLGFGPIAVFRGAARFESADPDFDPALLQAPSIVAGYWRPLHRELCAFYGARLSFEDFVQALVGRVAVHRAKLDVAPIAPGAEIVLSNSCLEHLFPLDATIARIAALQAPGARFLHAVDFGNHYPTPDPFDGLYAAPAEEYIARRGRAINLARIGDVERAFTDAGMAHRALPWWRDEGGYDSRWSDWWRQRYTPQDLRTRYALIVEAGPEERRQ